MVKRCGVTKLFIFFSFLFLSIIATQAYACLHDVNHDGDVDGADLATVSPIPLLLTPRALPLNSAEMIVKA